MCKMDTLHNKYAIFLYMDLTLLRSFLAIAKAGSITSAAEQLNVTQPALTRRLQQLEEHFGASLLARGRKGAVLTEIGKLVEHEARQIVARYEQLREQVAVHQRLEGGTIRIGGGATAVSFVLPEAIAAFQNNHPNVHFHLKEAGRSEIANDVATGQLEICLFTMPVHHRDLLIEPMLEDRIVLVAPHHHPLTRKKQVHLSDLTDMPFVGFEAGSAIRQIIDNALRDAGAEMNVVMELRSIPAILRMVATTGNLAFVSHLGTETHPDIHAIEVKGLSIQRQLALISRNGVKLSAAANAFVKRLKKLPE